MLMRDADIIMLTKYWRRRSIRATQQQRAFITAKPSVATAGDMPRAITFIYLR